MFLEGVLTQRVDASETKDICFYIRIRGVFFDLPGGDPVPFGLFDLRVGTTLSSSLYGQIWGRERLKSVLTSRNFTNILIVLSETVILRFNIYLGYRYGPFAIQCEGDVNFFFDTRLTVL